MSLQPVHSDTFRDAGRGLFGSPHTGARIVALDALHTATTGVVMPAIFGAGRRGPLLIGRLGRVMRAQPTRGLA